MRFSGGNYVSRALAEETDGYPPLIRVAIEQLFDTCHSGWRK